MLEGRRGWQDPARSQVPSLNVHPCTPLHDPLSSPNELVPSHFDEMARVGSCETVL